MSYYVYMIKTINGYRNKSYVGYTINLKNRLLKHNTNKGAKSTKGYKWKVIYKKIFKSKTIALTFEYKLKNDRKRRLKILNKNLNE